MNYVRSHIRDMQGYTAGQQPQAGKYIKLNTNENPYPASPSVTRAIQAALEQGLARYPDAMATAFRHRAAEVFGVDPDWILCGNGSDDILTIVTRAMVGQGELLRLPYPSYVLYKTLAEIQAARSEEIHFSQDWALTDAFFKAPTDLRLVFLPNPNSPSGTVVSRDVILQLAESLPCPLLVDEAYADFADTSCIDLVGKNEKIMVSRSLSKSHSLAGLRFGFLIAQPPIIQQLVKVKDSYNCDALSIAGACAAIDDREWLAENRRKIIATRARLEAGMSALGFSVQSSQANFVWCTHDARPLQPLDEGLQRNRVLVRYMNYPDWGDGLRISVGTDDQIDACLGLLESLM